MKKGHAEAYGHIDKEVVDKFRVGAFGEATEEVRAMYVFVALSLVPKVCEGTWKNEKMHTIRAMSEVTDVSDEVIVYWILSYSMEKWKEEIPQEIKDQQEHEDRDNTKATGKKRGGNKEKGTRHTCGVGGLKVFARYEETIRDAREADSSWDSGVREGAREEAIKRKAEVNRPLEEDEADALEGALGIVKGAESYMCIRQIPV